MDSGGVITMDGAELCAGHVADIRPPPAQSGPMRQALCLWSFPVLRSPEQEGKARLPGHTGSSDNSSSGSRRPWATLPDAEMHLLLPLGLQGCVASEVTSFSGPFYPHR